MGDTHVTSRRIPIAIEQPEKEELLKSEMKIKDESAQKSTKSKPQILNTLLTKPPQGKHGVQIQSAASNNQAENSFDRQNGTKSEIDFELIQNQLEVMNLTCQSSLYNLNFFVIFLRMQNRS